MLFEQIFAAWGMRRPCSGVSAALCATEAVTGGFGSGVNTESWVEFMATCSGAAVIRHRRLALTASPVCGLRGPSASGARSV